MINKYSPLINNQQNNCIECYTNIVGEKMTFINHLNESICIPILENASLELTAGVPLGWNQVNYVPITSITCFRQGNGLWQLDDGGIAYISWYLGSTIPAYSSNYEINQDVTIINKICGDKVKLRLKHYGRFLNTTGSTYMKIEDSTGVIWEATDFNGEEILCLTTNDSTINISLYIDIDEYQTKTTGVCVPVEDKDLKMYKIESLELCNYDTYYDVIVNEDFSSPYIPKKYNIVNQGGVYCGGDADIFMSIEYDLFIDYTKSYQLNMLYDSTGGSPSGVIEIFKNGLLVNSYPISTPNGLNQYITQGIAVLTTDTYQVKITITNMSPFEYCIKGLWIVNSYDFSDFGIDGCLDNTILDTIVCDCNSLTYYYNVGYGDSGWINIDGDKIYFRRPLACDSIIEFRYHNSCPIETDEGVYYFTDDEYGNPTPLYLSVEGVVFGNSPVSVDNTIQKTRFQNNRVFGEIGFQKDIAIDYIPEELILPLSLMALCDFIEMKIGTKWVRVYINDAIDADVLQDGNLNAKITLSYGGIKNKKCC